MGCLKKLLVKILIIAGIICFVAFGGWALLRDQINNFQNPAREVGIKGAECFGDFNAVSSDYQIGRTVGAFGYKKLKVTNRPSSQKIAFIEVKDNDVISPSDFSSSEIDKKLSEAIDKLDNDFITLENIKVVGRSTIQRKNPVKYVIFEADIKNVPFKKLKGVLGTYDKKDKKDKEHTYYIFSMTDRDKFSMKIVSDLLSEIR